MNKNHTDKEKKINLIYLIADAGFSGGPMQLLHLASNLDRRLFNITVLSPQGFLVDEIKRMGVKHIEYDFKLKNLLRTKSLRSLIETLLTGDDIIHAQGVRAGHFGRIVNKKLKLPLIYTEHNWTHDYKLDQNWRAKLQLGLMRRLDKYTTHTVAVSEAVRNFLLDKHITKEDKVSVIYNGVHFDDYGTREKWDQIVLGTIGSLSKRKGLIYLLEAIAKLKFREGMKVILKVVGTGKQENFLKQQSVDLKINFDIQWMGERADLSDFWSNINIYVQPSFDESFGMAVVEAMGNKIPVIATNVGALPEVVEEYGLLVRPGNSEDLVKAVQNIVNNESVRKENIKKAYNKVKKQFSVERMVGEYEKLYQRILN